MEQRLAALFASVGNALDSKTYTYSDSDYLVRKLLVKFLEDENALVASARHIPDPEQVVESILNYVISTEFANDDPASWYRKAMAITVEFADFAHRNDMSEDSARYAALLPDGHPRVKRVLPVTASAARNSLADWMAADPRLDAEAAEQVRKLYSLDEFADDVEAEFETLKAEALVAAGRMPEELLPIVAAFNLSFAQRSAISKALAAVRRRDRKGRFAREFGRLKLFFKSRGQFFSSSPRIVGPGRGENTYQVESKGDPNIPDGIYEVDAALGENIKAYLPKSAVKGLAGRKEVVAEDDKRFAIELDDFLKTKQDAPNNWTKSGNKFTTKDGKFTATKIDSNDAQKFIDKAKERGDEPIISGSGAGDAFDPADPDSFLITDNKGRTKGVAQDWAGVQEVSVASGAKLFDPTDPDFRIEQSPFPKERVSPDEPRPQLLKEGISEKRKAKEPDLDQDSSGALDKSKLSPSLIGEGYNFSKDGDNSWRKDDHGPDGETYTVEQGANGKWIVGEITGSDPFAESRDLEVFDNALEAFEYANDLGTRPSDFDEDWVNDLIAEQEGGPDLDQDQPEIDSRVKIDASKLSPELQEKYQETFDKFDQAIFNNDRQNIADMLSKAALDNDMPDEVYSVLSEARDWVANRDAAVENALYRASREDIENLLEDPEFAGWRDRLESAMSELAPFGQDGYDYDLDQDQESAPILSEKQAEPATGKQYAMLSEFLEERNLDPATEQALADAIENKNLNKAQASALIGLSRSADFKDGVDPTKPSDRMLKSLQGYLATKDLTPSEVDSTLKSLAEDSSRDNVEALLNKLRRKKDKPSDLNQGTGSLRKMTDDTYEWSDAYNYVDVMKTPNGWEVFYTNPDLNDRGGQTSHSQAFKSEEEALAFAEELVKENQEGKAYDRAADDLAAAVDLDQDQPTKPSLEEAATDKQYSFLESLLNGKKIDDPNLEAAARTAVQDKNLTKGEVGAFIGALRNLPDRPNVRREPTAKQVASIKRGIIERDFTPEQIKEIEDKLSSGVSFEEASEIIDDIKKRPVTSQGMDNLLDNLSKNQDIDTLQYLLTKPEYDEFRDSIKDTLRQLAIDTGDPNLQNLIDGREEPDLDQDIRSTPSYSVDSINSAIDDAMSDGSGFNDEPSAEDSIEINLDNGDTLILSNSMDAEGTSEGERSSTWSSAYIRPSNSRELIELAEFNEPNGWEAQQVKNALDNYYENQGPDLDQDQRPSADDINQRGLDIISEIETKGPILDETEEEFQDRIQGYRSALDRFVKTMRVGNSDMLERSDIRLDRSTTDSEIIPLLDELEGLATQARTGQTVDIDLDQDQPTRSVETKDLADQISKELDAIDFFTKNAASEAYDNFLNSDTASLAGSWIQDIRDFSEERDVPSELASKLQDLANRMEQEFIDRFGVADAARHSNDSSRDVMYLDDVALTVETEREMFFETDPDKIMDLMRTEDTYGDTRSGGAEIFVYQEEDGTYTAIVTYDRGSDEFTYDDRDDALAEAASAAADYNSDVMPSEYRDGELDELVAEAKNAKSPEDALEFADRIDGIAAALENSRGDLDVANSLREYGQRMREMAEKRQAFLESQTADELITPENQEEMATDPNLNPSGYARSVSDDLYDQFVKSEGSSGYPEKDFYSSKDGRVEVNIDFDAEGSSYSVYIDGQRVGQGSRLPWSDDLAAEVDRLVEEHFSKKA